MSHSVASSYTAFSSSLDLQTLLYLEDYQLNNSRLLPFTVCLEIALAAAHEFHSADIYSLNDVLYDEPLFFPPYGWLDIETRISSGGQTDGFFEIYNLLAGTQEIATIRHCHLSGKISRSSEPSYSRPIDLEKLRTDCTKRLSASVFYSALRELGFQYGASFQGIQQVWCRIGEALARIVPPESILFDMDLYHIHPALLDACI